MSSSPGIVVGMVVLAVGALIGGFFVRRARRTRLARSSGLERQSTNGSSRRSRRFGSEQVHLGERIESWTRPPPTSAPAMVPPPAASTSEASEALQPSAQSLPSPAPSGEGLVAPVELWFGSTRVGVVPGSATHEEFARYAGVLLSDLREH